MEKATKPGEILAPGAPCPSFELKSAPDRTLSLAQLAGKPAVLALYPADWSPVCGDQLALYNQIFPEFAAFGAQLVAISVDGPWCHRAYAEARKLRFPLLSDFEPKGALARSLGAYDPEEGVCRRALFVLDGQAIIRWSYLSPMDVNPGADGILAALAELTGKQVA